jgi:D-glycero-D-manno-heptose 1,7-bisphosphate phosphatase
VSRPALFLDRDGVINVDHAYVHRREDFDFVDGIFELCRLARQRGYLIFVVTNQAGIGRGKYTEQDFHALTEWMCGVFKAEGAPIDKVYFCPYHAEHGVGAYKIDSPFRKPNPGMILQAAAEYGVNLAGSVLLGDNETDVQAGVAAGVGCNLLFCPPATHKAPAHTIAHAVLGAHREADPYLR